MASTMARREGHAGVAVEERDGGGEGKQAEEKRRMKDE